MQKLIKSSDFFKTIDLVITPIILANEKNAHLYFNKAFTSQIGYTIEQMPDKLAWLEKAYPDEKYKQAIIENWDMCLQATQGSIDTHVNMVVKVCCADGSFKWFDIHEKTIGENKVITFLDVDDLRDSYDDLTDALKQKDILLSIIAHDVRSPLSNIKQIVNNYKSMDLSVQETEEIFFSMGIQIDYIFNIINSLLVRTSFNRSSFKEKREQIYLLAFFNKYGEYYKELMAKQGVDFVFELREEDKIEFDSFILDIICRNLIDNAIKYSPENGKIYISFYKNDDSAELVIRDVGPGMSETQKARILSNKSSRRLKKQITDSFGLGLVMAKEILEKHNGMLSIDSELGKGTSFVINLRNTNSILIE